MAVRPEGRSLEIRQDRPKRELGQRSGLRLDEGLSPAGPPLEIVGAKEWNNQTSQSALGAGGGDGLEQGLCERPLVLNPALRVRKPCTSTDLPEPEPPSTTTVSPRRTSSETPFNTSLRPKRLWTSA